MRSALWVKQQILIALGGGLALATGAACGGRAVPPDPDPSMAGTGGTGAGTTAATGAGGASGGPTTGTGGSAGDRSTGSGGASGTTPTGMGGTGGDTTTTTGTSGTGGDTTPTGMGGTGGGTTTTGTGGMGGTGGGTTATGTGGMGGGTTTTTGTGGATGGTGGATGGTGGTAGTGPTDPICSVDAGPPDPDCNGFGRICFSAAALARYLKSPIDGGPTCSLPETCPALSEFRTIFVCNQPLLGFSPSPIEGRCCYYYSLPDVGRPFVVDGDTRHAGVTERADWCAARRDRGEGHAGPDGQVTSADGTLTAAERVRLADAWLADAKAEHASIAAFARLTLQLLSLGAPPELLILTQRAAEDEIAHAQLCFALASRFAGRPLGPSELTMSGAVTDVSLAELATAAIREGCVGETTAAVLAGEALERARDPEVRAALAKIVNDETRHAELAWRTVVWAIERGGRAVHDAVRAAFDEAMAAFAHDATSPTDDAIDDKLASYGRLSAAATRRVQKAVLREVVRPIAESLATVVGADRARRGSSVAHASA